MNELVAALVGDGPPLLADGAMGTMLQAAGLPPGTPSDEWTISHPAAVRAVHQSYVAAGSDMVLTNTLNGGHPAAAVALARESGARWVAGSLGPGAGEAQAQALAAAGVDALWLETQLGLADCLASVRACQRVTPLPLLVSFSFHRPDGRTQAGEAAAEVAQALAEAGVTALGLNCGLGTVALAARLRELAAGSTMPLIVKPNAGLPRLVAGQWRYPSSPRAWAAAVGRALPPGRARLVGGCCGTTPAHLYALHTRLRH